MTDTGRGTWTAIVALLVAAPLGAQGPSHRAAAPHAARRDSVSVKPPTRSRHDSSGVFASRADSLLPDALHADSAAPLLPRRPDEELSDVGIRRAGSVRFCYEREGLGRDPSLKAMLDVTVTIAADGAVTSVAVDTSRVIGQGARAVVSCVARAVAQWRYQPGPYGPESTTYTFNLAPAGKP